MRSKRHIAPQGKEPVFLPTANTPPHPSDTGRAESHQKAATSPPSHQNDIPTEHVKEPEPRSSKYPCPCCGCYTLPVPAADAVAYICPVCFWENDVFLSRDDEPSDENHGLTLREARANFKQYHACDPCFLQYVRTSGQDAPTAFSPEAK